MNIVNPLQNNYLDYNRLNNNNYHVLYPYQNAGDLSFHSSLYCISIFVTIIMSLYLIYIDNKKHTDVTYSLCFLSFISLIIFYMVYVFGDESLFA